MMAAGLWLGLSWGIRGEISPPVPRLLPGWTARFWVLRTGASRDPVSPNRGLFVCVPLLAGALLVGLRYRKALRFRGLLALVWSLMAAHVVVTAGYPQWWGGHCFGARLIYGVGPLDRLDGSTGRRCVAARAARESPASLRPRGLGCYRCARRTQYRDQCRRRLQRGSPRVERPSQHRSDTRSCVELGDTPSSWRPSISTTVAATKRQPLPPIEY